MLEIRHSPGPPNPIEKAEPDSVSLDVNKINLYYVPDDIFNKSKDTSDIYRINHRDTDRVSIDNDTADGFSKEKVDFIIQSP